MRYVARCGSKNGYKKDMSLKEVGPHLQIMIIVLGSIVNIIGRRTYMTI